MATILINLKDIIIDPDTTVDLVALPASDAIERIKQSYGLHAVRFEGYAAKRKRQAG